jgi:hypothetical protein
MLTTAGRADRGCVAKRSSTYGRAFPPPLNREPSGVACEARAANREKAKHVGNKQLTGAPERRQHGWPTASYYQRHSHCPKGDNLRELSGTV